MFLEVLFSYMAVSGSIVILPASVWGDLLASGAGRAKAVPLKAETEDEQAVCMIAACVFETSEFGGDDVKMCVEGSQQARDFLGPNLISLLYHL